MNLDYFRNIPFRTQDLSCIMPDCSNLKMKAKRLENDGKITRLKKGLYVTNPAISHAELSPFLLANHLYGPSYISMYSALRYYGLIPEAVYIVQSMTTGGTKSYTNKVGRFSFTHVPAEYFNVGVTIREENGVSFMIATPEKALCDLMVYTPNLNLRFQTSLRCYIEEDIRLDMDELLNFNLDIIKACAEISRKKSMLNQLIKFINHERDI